MTTEAHQKPEQMPVSRSSFEREAAAVLHEQRCALVGVLGELRPPVRRATDLNRLLNLNQKLSWSLFKSARAEDARVLAALLPGRRPMERFLDAAAQHGVRREAIERARAAFDRFEETVSRHGGGSRDVFESMVADLGTPDVGSGALDEPLTAAAEARQRRAMYRAASILFGRQARTSFGAIILQPSRTPGLVDSASIKGMVGLHKTRRGVPLQTMTHHLRLRKKADPQQHGVLESLDPRESGPDAVGLMRDFCSQPPPRFGLESMGDGIKSVKLEADGMGASSEVTYFIGHVCRDAEVPPQTPGAETSLTKGYEMPAQVDISDVFMHESLWDETLPEVKVYKWPTLGWTAPLRESDLLPMTEKAACLGRGPYAGRTPHVPMYEEMMGYAMEQLGWNAQEFRLFRVQVEYPVIHTRLRMVFAGSAK